MVCYFTGNGWQSTGNSRLAKILNISLNEIVAFGDDKNDMEMLKMCGIGIAVDNAISDVKAIADCVTLSNDENGVAEWLAKNVLMSVE